MKKILIFLFVFVFFPSDLEVNNVFCESIKNTKISKIKEFANPRKTVRHHEDLLDDNCGFTVDTTTWHNASASYYDALDSSQTKDNPDGIGAFGRRIHPGSIALGSSVTKVLIEKNLIAFVEVKDLKDVNTPYGKGVFRVDDKMGCKFSKKNRFYVDFNQHDLNQELRRLGRFKIRFRFVGFAKTGSL